MDYLKTVVPSQLLAERGSNLVVINPGSANVRIGLAQQDAPISVPHCIARRTSQVPKKNVQDQLLNSQVTTAQHMERERAYDIIASLLKIRFLDEEVTNNQYPQKMGRVDALPPQINNKKETVIPWTDVFEKCTSSSSAEGCEVLQYRATRSVSMGIEEYICGEEALRISPTEPYCLRRPIRRGHLNISLHYPMQQVIEDMHAIWDWILVEKLHIPHSERHMYSAILVVPETFDNREIKELLSIVLRDLCFSTAVVHQEGLAAVFGNGLSTACVVNIGAQVTSVICIEDGVALPTTQITLRYGGEDISRCLLWTQRHHQTWPPIRTDALTKPIDLLMLNRLKESHCQIREGEVEAVAVVHSYEDGVPPGSHKTRLTALNVPPMGLFYPMLLVPDVYPPPPRTWFSDNEDMLEETWDFPRRTDMSDGYYPGTSGFFPMWENYPIFQAKPKKQDSIGLADAITKSILSTGRIDLQRKLFCSMQLIGGVALTEGLISAVEERVLHAIPSHEAIDTVEVLQSRTNPASVSWKGGAILGILDFTRDAWIHREDWIRNGIHIGSGRKYPVGTSDIERCLDVISETESLLLQMVELTNIPDPLKELSATSQFGLTFLNLFSW
ncbi:UNVERIFIED_CONTAM: Actin-related protein 9 [Sesamum radiatum]|uniref:Actin-related protein 9 n=1 Tax=Sesamum radiatum TaxID=300843 RepID=A0AAW2UCI1_SESRA